MNVRFGRGGKIEVDHVAHVLKVDTARNVVLFVFAPVDSCCELKNAVQKLVSVQLLVGLGFLGLGLSWILLGTVLGLVCFHFFGRLVNELLVRGDQDVVQASVELFNDMHSKKMDRGQETRSNLKN